MDSNMSPRKLLAQSGNVVGVWRKHPDLLLNGGPLREYRRIRKRLRKALNRLAKLEQQVRAEANERDRLAEHLNELTIRARAAVRGYFGPDSTEYGLAGGTRRSERRKHRKKGAQRAGNQARPPIGQIALLTRVARPDTPALPPDRNLQFIAQKN
jgi:hypothetical protein